MSWRLPLLCAAMGLALAAPACASGAPAPTSDAVVSTDDIVVSDLNGAPVRLSDFRGQVVFLDFWATWCEPCRESLPIYDIWQRELGADGLRIVAVSVDEDAAAAKAFATAHAPSLTVLHDPNGDLAGRFDLPTMPTAYLVGRDGTVLRRHVGFETAEAEALRAELVTALSPTSPTAPQEASR